MLLNVIVIALPVCVVMGAITAPQAINVTAGQNTTTAAPVQVAGAMCKGEAGPAGGIALEAVQAVPAPLAAEAGPPGQPIAIVLLPKNAIQLAIAIMLRNAMFVLTALQNVP